MFFKKKVIVKLFKPKDSNKCVYQKKNGYCETFQTSRFHRIMFIKKKVIAKLFKAKDTNKCAYLKVKKVIVKLFKHKDSIQECLFKKS